MYELILGYRSKFRSSEMPQAFQYDVIEKAYKEVCYKAIVTQ